jgi:2-oxoglutarate ferredoxin oxidoreductase subunit beta
MPLNDTPLAYCAGCSHSHLHAILLEVLEQNSWHERCLGVSGSGCSSGMQAYFPFQIVSAPPGQAPAVATGLKRAWPDKLIFTYQGDGDLAARGFDVLMHMAMRGEAITVICLNNLVMAGSGGQMSPTTLTGQITTSTRLGRSTARSGRPVKLAETVARMPHVAFAQRVALHDPQAVKQAKLALQDAFLFQDNGQGLTFIEVLGWCPPYWDRTAVEARDYLTSQVLKIFPLGIFQNRGLQR